MWLYLWSFTSLHQYVICFQMDNRVAVRCISCQNPSWSLLLLQVSEIFCTVNTDVNLMASYIPGLRMSWRMLCQERLQHLSMCTWNQQYSSLWWLSEICLRWTCFLDLGHSPFTREVQCVALSFVVSIHILTVIYSRGFRKQVSGALQLHCGLSISLFMYKTMPVWSRKLCLVEESRILFPSLLGKR